MTPYIGEIRMWGGNFAPQGWLFCNGQAVAISDYSTLFNLIGTTYGGDGQTSFQMPNLMSRVPIHIGSGYTLGQSAGTETVTLNSNQIPGHGHTLMASTSGGNQNSPGSGNVLAQSGVSFYINAPATAAMGQASIGSAGGNQPHSNIMPYLAVSFIIATEGIYPSQG